MIVLGVAIVLLGLAFVVFVRRRRARHDGTRPGDPDGGEATTDLDAAVNATDGPQKSDREAW